jgi:hypothetical protein
MTAQRPDTEAPAPTADNRAKRAARLSLAVARAEGLAADVAERDGDEGALALAAVLEAARHALRTAKGRAALQDAARRLLFAATGLPRKTYGRPGEYGAIAMRLRDALARQLLKRANPPPADAYGYGINGCTAPELARVLDMLVRLEGRAASALFPDVADDQRVASFERSIDRVLMHTAPHARELAEKLITHCARGAGFKRASRLFDAELRRVDRTDKA